MLIFSSLPPIVSAEKKRKSKKINMNISFLSDNGFRGSVVNPTCLSSLNKTLLEISTKADRQAPLFRTILMV